MMKQLLLAALLAPFAVQAQQVDCARGDLNQVELNFCAGEELELADEELNFAYRLALTEAKAIDAQNAAAGIEMPVPLEEALRQAQREWVDFRDDACAAEALLVQGGTAQPMVGTLCLARLTRTRTEDLAIFTAPR